MLTFQCTLRRTGLYFRSPPSHSVCDYYLASLVPCPPKHTTLSLQKKFQTQPQLLNSLSLPDPLISHLLAHGNLLNKHLVNKQSPLFMFHCSKAKHSGSQCGLKTTGSSRDPFMSSVQLQICIYGSTNFLCLPKQTATQYTVSNQNPVLF